MKPLWNDRWARIAALLILGGVCILCALEAQPAGAEIVEMIGLKWTALLVFGLVVAAIVLLFPGWWPLWRARRDGLSNAWVFALVTWGFATASLETVLILLLVPVAGFNVYFAPQLQYDGLLSADTRRFLGYVTEYWWASLPFLQIFATLWVTRWLAHRWPSVDRAMGGDRDSTVGG